MKRPMNPEEAIQAALEEAYEELDRQRRAPAPAPAVIYEHPRNNTERAEFIEHVKALYAEGYTIDVIETENPKRPEYRIEFASREEQVAFLARGSKPSGAATRTPA